MCLTPDALAEAACCLKKKRSLLLSSAWEKKPLRWQEKSESTYPVNLLGPHPNHLRAFSVNRKETFGHLFMGKYNLNSNCSEWNNQKTETEEISQKHANFCSQLSGDIVTERLQPSWNRYSLNHSYFSSKSYDFYFILLIFDSTLFDSKLFFLSLGLLN